MEKDNQNTDKNNDQNNETEDQRDIKSKEESNKKVPEDKLVLELEQMKKSVEEYKDKFLRIAAEYENYRKRSEKEKLLIYSNATSNTISVILPVVDSLELALKSMKNVSEEYQKGLSLVNNQLLDSLNKLNVEPFGKTGDKFNPDIHNAVSHIKDENNDNENFISEVFQKGYMVGDKVIRHAMVQVTN